MKILFPFVGDTIGGAHISTLLALSELRKRGVTANLLVHEDGPFVDYLRAQREPLLQLPLPGYVGRQVSKPQLTRELFRSRGILQTFLKESDIQIIHTNDSRMNMTWVLPVKAAGRAFVWHQRSLFADQRIMHLLARRADRIICPSRAILQSLPSRLRSMAVRVTNPFSIPTAPREEHRRNLEAALEIETQQVVVGFVANLSEQKRPVVFLEAASLMVSSAPSIRWLFVLVGRDRDHLLPQLRKQVEDLGLTGKVLFPGHLPRIAEMLGGFDILLAPAVGEGHGRVLIEAALAGVPVVASRSAGHIEAVVDGMTGVLVPPDDPSEFARASISLIEDGSRLSAIADTASAHARDRYSVEGYVDIIMNVYGEVLSR